MLSSHAGGIAGKNEKEAVIDRCTLEITDTNDSELCAKYGMLGGITGYNKGTITMSGDAMTTEIMKPNEKSDR